MIGLQARGLLSGLGAQCLWGSGILFWAQLAYLNELTVLSQRMLWSFVFGFMILFFTGRLGEVKEALLTKKSLGILFLASLALSLNWILYLWVLNHEMALEASLGYYFAPILNICIARIFFKERLTNLQCIAMVLVCVAVGYATISYGDFPLFAFLIGVSFAAYAYLHKIIRIDPVPAFFVEMLCISPFCIVWLLYSEPQTFGMFGYGTKHFFLLAASIFFTGIPLMFYAFAVKTLRLSTIAFVQYLSPSVNFLLAVFVMGEQIKSSDYVVFPLIWSALFLITWNTLRNLKRLPIKK